MKNKVQGRSYFWKKKKKDNHDLFIIDTNHFIVQATYLVADVDADASQKSHR
jgi:hypothetical protein